MRKTRGLGRDGCADAEGLRCEGHSFWHEQPVREMVPSQMGRGAQSRLDYIRGDCKGSQQRRPMER